MDRLGPTIGELDNPRSIYSAIFASIKFIADVEAGTPVRARRDS